MSIRTWLTKITGAANNEDQFPVQKISYLGKDSNANMLFPFGLYGNADNDVAGFMWVVGNSTENKFVIPYDPLVRPELEQGEVALYRPKGDALIKFTNDGNIEISTTASVNVTAPDVTVTASSTVTIDSPTVSMTGDLDVTGDITANEVTAGTTVLTTHTHIGSPTAATGAQSPTGVPN